MRRMSHQTARSYRLALLLFPLLLALSACQIPDPFVASSHRSSFAVLAASPSARNIPAGWKTFTDPILGFSISYPSSWTLVGDSHITLVSQNAATLSPIVTTVTQSPAAALAKIVPSSAVQAQQHQSVTQTRVAGQPAVDIFSPYIPANFQAPNSGRGIGAGRAIVMAVPNDAGTTNVYTFLAAIPTDKTGKMSAASLADNQMVAQIVATFQLPAKIDPVTTP